MAASPRGGRAPNADSARVISGPSAPDRSALIARFGGSSRAYFLVASERHGRPRRLVRCDRWRWTAWGRAGGRCFPCPRLGGVRLAGGQQGAGARGGRLRAVHSYRVFGVGGDAGVRLPAWRCRGGRAGGGGATGAGGGPGTDGGGRGGPALAGVPPGRGLSGAGGGNGGNGR